MVRTFFIYFFFVHGIFVYKLKMHFFLKCYHKPEKKDHFTKVYKKKTQKKGLYGRTEIPVKKRFWSLFMTLTKKKAQNVAQKVYEKSQKGPKRPKRDQNCTKK